MPPATSRIHRSFRKYVGNLNHWEIKDLKTTSDQGVQAKKACDRFRAVRDSIPLNRQAAKGVKFSVFVIFIPSSPESPPDIIFTHPNDEVLYERTFEALLPTKWTQGGDRALQVLLDEVYEAHKEAQRNLFLSLADKRVQDNLQLAIGNPRLSLFVSGRQDDQELWLSMPVDLHKKTKQYILSQLPDAEDRTNGFMLDVCWKANRQTASPVAQFLRWPELYDEFMQSCAKLPQWHNRDDVFHHIEDIAGAIEVSVNKHEKDFELRKQFIESLTKELCVRTHEHDSVRFSKCSFYFVAGKKEQPLIVFLDLPTFPMDLPTIEVQAPHLFDRDGNPLRDELAIYQPSQCTIDQLVSNIRGRVQKRVPQILNELEKRHVRAREERAQPEGQAPKQGTEVEGKPGGSSHDKQSAPPSKPSAASPSRDAAAAAAQGGDANNAKREAADADRSQHNGGDAASSKTAAAETNAA